MINYPETGSDRDFWEKIEKIDGLSVEAALGLASGKLDVYEKLLKYIIREIEKCMEQAPSFLTSGDLHNFTVLIHSMKTSLANIGVASLSANARALEMASDSGDAAFCSMNLPPFLVALGKLYLALKGAFECKYQKQGAVVIPPELPSIFKKMEAAFDQMDFTLIDELATQLDALDCCDSLKDELEQIKDAALTMDYEEAKELMRGLLEKS